MKKIGTTSAVLLSVLTVFAVWKILSLQIKNPLILPSANAVCKNFLFLFADRIFWRALGNTASRVLKAFLISAVCGIFFGTLSGCINPIKKFLKFPLWIVRATPLVSLVMIFLFWLPSSKIAIFSASLVAFPIVADSCEKGTRAVDKKLLESLRFFCVPSLDIFKVAHIPQAVPFLQAGFSASYGLIWKAVVAGEVLSLPRFALGTLLYEAQVHLESASVFALTFAIIFCGFFSEWILSFLFKCIFSAYHKKKHFTKIDFANVPDHAQTPSLKAKAIEALQMNVCYGKKVVLNNFNFFVPEKKVYAILAPSGAGKTTLLYNIAQELCKKKVAFSFVQQESLLLKNLTLFENVYLPLKNIFSPKEAKSRALYFLEKAKLLPLANSFPDEVSGGEKQRAALARAFAYPAPILLMDEAFQSQDIALECNLLDLFCEFLKTENRTVLFSSHNVREACVLSDSIFVLRGNPLCVVKEFSANASRKNAKTQYAFPTQETVFLEKRIVEELLGSL